MDNSLTYLDNQLLNPNIIQIIPSWLNFMETHTQLALTMEKKKILKRLISNTISNMNYNCK